MLHLCKTGYTISYNPIMSNFANCAIGQKTFLNIRPKILTLCIKINKLSISIWHASEVQYILHKKGMKSTSYAVKA